MATDNAEGNQEFDVSFLRMFFLGMVVISPSFLAGLNQSYATIALPQMNLNLNDASWFGSIGGISSPISTILSGVILDKYGRKPALVFSLLPSIAGWLLLLWNYNVPAALVGQFLNGFTIGAIGCTSQVYASECLMMNHVQLRNSYLMWSCLSYAAAALTMFVLATFLQYRQICAIVAAIALLFLFALCLYIPESPTWLYHQGRFGDAELSQKKLRITQPILKSCSRENFQPPPPNHPQWHRIYESFNKLRRPDVWKPLLTFSVFSILNSFSGFVCVLTYMIDIFDGSIYEYDRVVPNGDSTNDTADISNPYLYNAVSGLFMFVSSIIGAFGLPYIGVRNLLIFSSLGSCLAMTTLMYTAVAVSDQGFWIRIVSVWIIAAIFSVSAMLPFSVAGDALPTDAKGFSSICHLCGTLSSAIIRKAFPYLAVTLGAYVYGIFGVVCLLCALQTFFCVKEIVGKTLDEISSEYLTTSEQNS